MLFPQYMFSSFASSSSWDDTKSKSFDKKYDFSSSVLDDNSLFWDDPFLYDINLINPYSIFPNFNRGFDRNPSYQFNSNRSRSRASLGSYSIPSEYKVKRANSLKDIKVCNDDKKTIGEKVITTAFQFYGLGENRSNNPESLEYGNNMSDMFFGFNNNGRPWCMAYATSAWLPYIGDVFGSQGYNRFNQGELGSGANTKGGISTWARANNVWTNLQSTSLEEVKNTIKPGDLVIYNKDGKSYHGGLIFKIEKEAGKYVAYTLEGNINDGTGDGKIGTRKIDLNIAKQEGSVDFVRMNDYAAAHQRNCLNA